ncbi:MAG TPA: hypothetical protein VMW82_02260 [Candidatus Paceibacterota bacterium]|nr:hypothetical protein [Candidatus Paceibacterota bacterium]
MKEIKVLSKIQEKLFGLAIVLVVVGGLILTAPVKSIPEYIGGILAIAGACCGFIGPFFPDKKQES